MHPSMNIETLIEICRPGELKQWDNDDNLIINIKSDEVAKWKLLDEEIQADGSPSYINDLNGIYYIQNIETNKIFKVVVGHDSWSEWITETFRNPIINEVEYKEVTEFQYVEKENSKDTIIIIEGN